MKKMIWFTKAQLVLLENLNKRTSMNNAEIVREGMRLLDEKLVAEGK